MQATSTTTSNTTSNTAAAASPVLAFFSRREDKGPNIAIFRSTSTAPRAPLFSGKIGDKRVAFFLRQGAKGPFLGLVGNKLDNGNSEDLGTANIVTAKAGAPRLVIQMGEQRLFGSVSKKLDQAMLVSLGLNEDLQRTKREASEAAAVAAAAIATAGAEQGEAVPG